MRLVIYEHASAQPDNVCLPESVRREGRAMLDAVVADARALEPAVEVDAASELEQLPQSAGEEFALLIAPEFDGILQRCAEVVLAKGYQLLSPLPCAIALTSDKWRLYEHWQQRGVPTPMTWKTEQLMTAERCLIKHRYGAGSLGIARWQPGIAMDDNYLVQEELPGIALSLALLVSPSGHLTPLQAARQHVSVDGHYHYLGGELLLEEALHQQMVSLARQALADIPGLRGYVGVDMVLSDGRLWAIEINPRLTTSYLGLRQAASRNLVACMLEVVRGDCVVPVSFNKRLIHW